MKRPTLDDGRRGKSNKKNAHSNTKQKNHDMLVALNEGATFFPRSCQVLSAFGGVLVSFGKLVCDDVSTKAPSRGLSIEFHSFPSMISPIGFILRVDLRVDRSDLVVFFLLPVLLGFAKSIVVFPIRKLADCESR